MGAVGLAWAATYVKKFCGAVFCFFGFCLQRIISQLILFIGGGIATDVQSLILGFNIALVGTTS
jgi:hypothetical protein